MQPFSLYVHIPYCDSKCPYCDFNSYAVKHWPEAAYRDALIAEMSSYAADPRWRGRPLHSIFFGGGTPSLFAPQSIEALLEAAARLWDLPPSAEITLEANPGTVDGTKLAGFRAAGVNRISFGVQSFQPRLLERLGRIHDADQARAGVTAAHEVGFDEVNLDLMFAIPGQTLHDVDSDVTSALALHPTHISAYNLTYEDETAFTARRRAGALIAVPEEAEVAMFGRVRARLAAGGYAQYEISNYAPPGHECAHNLNYWRSGDYLGVGAGAHSWARDGDHGQRWSNERSPGRYLERIRDQQQARVSDETLSPAQARGEFAFLGLRCRAGIECALFEERFGLPLRHAFPHIDGFERDGFVEQVAGSWRLTERGLLFADTVFATFA